MILVDANLLVYAANTAAPEQTQARDWLDDRLNGTAPVGLPWPSLLAFARLVTNPVVLSQPVSTADAWKQIEVWLLKLSARASFRLLRCVDPSVGGLPVLVRMRASSAARRDHRRDRAWIPAHASRPCGRSGPGASISQSCANSRRGRARCPNTTRRPRGAERSGRAAPDPRVCGPARELLERRTFVSRQDNLRREALVCHAEQSTTLPPISTAH
jgi:predicted nucleic acid-binding protein